MRKRGEGSEGGSGRGKGSCCSTRRTFLKQTAVAGVVPSLVPGMVSARPDRESSAAPVGIPRVFGAGALARIAFPLGGIGTGTISLGGRGQLRDWEIFNEPEKGYTPHYAFAAIRAAVGDDEPVVRVLEAKLEPPYDGESGLDWMNAPGLPRLEVATFRGVYPIASVGFEDSTLPVEVVLEAFNPLVPLDPEASGLPAAVLRYRVHNPHPREARVSIAFSLDNPLGTDGRVNEHRREGGLEGLVMINPELAAHDPKRGSLVLAVVGDGAEVTHLSAWREYMWTVPVRGFWEDFSGDGALDPTRHRGRAPDRPVRYEVPTLEVGSVCASKRIGPHGDDSITFLLAWHFPNRTPEVCGWPAPPGEEKTVIGNHYATRFADAWDAARHLASELPHLESRCRRFVAALQESDLPEEVLEAATSNLSVLRTNSCFRTADGRFHGFEGCKEKGCCFGSCTHVWNYEAALPFLFPTLSRSLRELHFGFATDEEGRMDYRYLLPYGEQRFGRTAADGQMGALVKLYLDWRLCGDDEWLAGIWPQARKALEFAWVEGGWDGDRDGVMEGCQHNTYDVEFLGPNPLCGIWYLAALRAAEEMAQQMDDPAAARRYRELFERGSAWVDANLFNGQYYVQRIEGRPAGEIAPGLLHSGVIGDPEDPDCQLGEGCLADQLLGQTIAHLADLGDLLAPERVRTALESIFQRNFEQPLDDHAGLVRTYALNDESGLVLCDYTDVPRPRVPFFYHSEVWSGVEYQVAAHLFVEGQREQALEIIRAVRQRHDGVRRNPWDEAECGHHYVRSMASWLSVWLLLGFHYDAGQARVRLRPRMEVDPARGFWCVPGGWGTYTFSLGQEGAFVRIAAEEGALSCRTLEVWTEGRALELAALRWGGQGHPGAAARAGDSMRVMLEGPLTVEPAKSMELRLV